MLINLHLHFSFDLRLFRYWTHKMGRTALNSLRYLHPKLKLNLQGILRVLLEYWRAVNVAL
jgi:hypothetical protein